MQLIGKLNKKILGIYKDKITTEDVIITDERIQHIKKRHPQDYEEHIKDIPYILNNPDYILEDKNKMDTLILLKRIIKKQKNIQLIIKLNTNNYEKEKSNTIITFWRIRDVNYKKTIQNNKIIYNNIDKKE